MNENELVQNSYNLISDEFKSTRVYTWKWTDEFMENIKKNSTVLDIGCGTGRNLMYKGINTIGIDISIKQLNNCESPVINCDMYELPFRDKIFDNIIIIASFHHLSTTERRHRALLEMKRTIKSGGQILLSVWSINQPLKTRRKFTSYGDTIVNWRTIPRYYYIFEINELKILLSQYFTIVKHYWDTGNEIFTLIKD